MIEIKNACYCYQASEKNSLSKVNLNVAPGEVVCLTGASGSGKTTLTRLVNGLIPHYYEGKLSGKIEVCGLTPSNHELWELAPKVGSVFQNPKTQFFCLDTTGELAFACENQGIAPNKIRTRLKAVTNALELTGLIDRSCLSLSGGEKQRVACGSATMLDPDVLVLDEPSSNLDFASIGLLRKIVAKWKAEGCAVLISEHRLHWLEGIADRIVVMRSGSVEREITSKQFYAATAAEARALGLRAPTFAAIAAEQCCTRGEKNEFVEIRDMNYHYPQSNRGISVSRISFRRGGVTAIIGSNGVGKSTFARCLCGLVRNCKGTVDVGEGPHPLSSRSRNGSLVMQDVSHQLFRESVFDEVLASTRHADEHLTRTILASLDLTELAQRHPLSLSGGQMQRVALATALASGRNLLVLDEPTSGLDLAHMEQVAASVTAAAAEGRAVVVVTHDPEFIRTCCTDFARMEDGSFVDQGALDDAGWSKVLSFLRTLFRETKRIGDTMDIANYADMGGNVRRVTHDTDHSVWRAEGTDGQGIMTMHDVMPGITLMFNDFTSVWNLESGFKLTPGSRMLCLNYCREGRIEWESGTDSCLYLDVGDLGIDDHARHESLFRFPFGHYRGVTVCLDPDIADKSLQSMFPEGFPVSVKQLYERFCSSDEPSVLRSGPSVEHIFCEIYNAHDRFRDAYLKLKIMELLLFLGSNIPEGGRIGQYGLTRAQVDKVKEIEQAITSDLSSHKTLKELSQEFEFPYASMQRWFKEVYGTSVHVYLTRYRMAQAATLLRTTSKPIGEVAFEVGYTNASKFASTFRNVVGMAPGDYRESAGQER